MRNLILLMIILCIGCSEKKNESTQSKQEQAIEWRELNHKDSIPEIFKMALVQINNGAFELANPDEIFNSTDVREDSLLNMKLSLLLEKNNEWRISYVRGGFAKHYAYAQCKIYEDSLSDLKIAESVLSLDNIDSIEKYISNGNIELKK